MIRRIVKMSFQLNRLEDFFTLFEKNKSLIKSQEGCFELKLLKDQLESGIVFTSSLWSDEVSLNNYRKSEVFKRIWPETKKLFKDRPEAWSCREDVV